LWRIVAALAVLALVSVAGFALLQYMIWSQESAGVIINVAGKQRMLSQRAPRLLLESLEAPGEEARQERLKEFEATLDLMERDHLALVHGDPERGLPGDPPEAVRALYHGQEKLDERVLSYIQALRALGALPRERLAHEPAFHQVLEQSRYGLLKDLNRAVKLYEQDASQAVADLYTTQGLLVLLTLLVLVLEAAFIFRPMIRMLRRQLQSLEKQRMRMQLVLDNTGDALWLVDQEGKPLPLRSQMAEHWFGMPHPEVPIWEHLFAQEPDQAQMLSLGLEELQEDIMPAEVVLSQLPQAVRRKERDLALSYVALDPEQNNVGAVMIAARDITEQLEHQRSEMRNRSVQSFVRYLLSDRTGTTAAVREMERLLGELGEDLLSEAAFKRTLHTIKGNASIYGLEMIAQRAHELEDQLALDSDLLSPRQCQAELQKLWSQLLQEIEVFLDTEHSGVMLQTAEYKRFLGMVEHSRNASMLRVVRSWQYPQLQVPLQRLQRQTDRLAEQLSREVQVHVKSHGLRADLEGTDGFWSSLIHVLRNALDHGLEPVQERQEQGKPAVGNVWLEAHVRGNGLEVSIRDDGRGIDWEKVSQRAQDRGLPCGDRQELVAALLSDGFSTRDEVSALSGRGVGTASVRQETEKLGGEIEVDSTTGKGTVWRFFFPHRRVASPFLSAHHDTDNFHPTMH
jgi:two-component system chemotaxis sensor kinase CheA